MEDFASYILSESKLSEKLIIVNHLSRKVGIYFDKSIILRAEIAKLFIEYMNLDVDENEVVTAMLLCNCKKVENAQKIGKLETYAKEGAEYLATLGFSPRFCKMCEEVNRYSQSSPRLKESDILELVDQFTGLILKRIERDAYTTEEAMIILKERNLKYADNRYLDAFETFVKELDNITIKDVIDVPIIKKLVHLHNKEANVMAFIASLSNIYEEKFEIALDEHFKKKTTSMLSKTESNDTTAQNNNMERMKELAKKKAKTCRALFSEETTRRLLNYKSE